MCYRESKKCPMIGDPEPSRSPDAADNPILCVSYSLDSRKLSFPGTSWNLSDGHKWRHSPPPHPLTSGGESFGFVLGCWRKRLGGPVRDTCAALHQLPCKLSLCFGTMHLVCLSVAPPPPLLTPTGLRLMCPPFCLSPSPFPVERPDCAATT